MRPAIRVDRLSKKYVRGGGLQREYATLRDSLVRVIQAPWRRLRSQVATAPAACDSFWALKDVSFDVQPGEILGVIGHNGAGKSTLLKVLSSIVEPTAGRAEIRGRLGSLLEVGTGFHTELTGRENIYMNGSILGMGRREIARKFDQIVAFSEIEAFLDTPVKRYSSGMFVRLAFAVAAHLEPEILIVDEVLAVGDTAFQRKCLGKMGSIAGEGRTILFVSHDLSAVQALCNRGIVIRQGELIQDAPIDRAVATYLHDINARSAVRVADRTDRNGKGLCRISKIEIVRPDDPEATFLTTGSPARFVFHVSNVCAGLSCKFTLYNARDLALAYCDSNLPGEEDGTADESERTFQCDFDELPLLPGRYRLNASLVTSGEVQDHLDAAIFIEVHEGVYRGRAASPHKFPAAVFLPHRWTRPVG